LRGDLAAAHKHIMTHQESRMFKQHSGRSGFTLPEVLVTVAIIAVLAAMVVPAVTQQIGKGDAPSMQGSVTGLRTAVTSFVSDVRKFPGAVTQLQDPISNTDKELGTTAANGTAFTTAIAGRWKGPYESSGNTTGQIPLGQGWVTVDSIFKTSAPAYTVFSLTKTNATVGDAADLDMLVDGVGIADSTAGLIRWHPAALSATAALVPAATVMLYLMSAAQ
jgi:type IV pilus assembly protein PilE